MIDPSPKDDAQYRRLVTERLGGLSDVFAKAAIGDFSSDLEIPPQDDEFTELYAGIQIMLEVIREKTRELEQLNQSLEEQVKQRTAELTASEASLRGFLEAAPDAFVVVDDSGKIAQVNKQATSLFGYSGEELVGQKIEALIPKRFQGRHVKHRSGYIHNPKTRPMGTDLDLYALRKDGSEFPVEVSLSPVRGVGKLQVIAIVRDVTVRKKSEQALAERAKELERFNRLMVGRELKMAELKEEIDRLKSSTSGR